MFVIRIKQLQARTRLGVHEWEKEAKRHVILNIEMQVDASQAGQSDELADTVDYAMIEQHVVQRLEMESYQLLERLACDIGEFILFLDRRIRAVQIEADKPGALRQASSVSVSATLTRAT